MILHRLNDLLGYTIITVGVVAGVFGTVVVTIHVWQDHRSYKRMLGEDDGTV